MKIAFLFAGQGAQAVGMGKELAENYACAARVFDEASEALDINMRDLVFDGNEDTLKITENTQPAIVTVNEACRRVAQEKGIQPFVAAGLSLGEYNAYVAARSIPFGRAVALVRKRGRYMQEAVPIGEGGMAAVLGLGEEPLRQVCERAGEIGIVEPANFNCPGQIVISGAARAVERACELALEAGAKRAIPLPVSAPFHCSLMKPAAEKLAAELSRVEFGKMSVPVITNVTADYVKAEADITELLIRQVYSPVRFEGTIRRMLADGVQAFVELGPGRAMSGFVKKVDRTIPCYNIENISSLEETLAGLGV